MSDKHPLVHRGQLNSIFEIATQEQEHRELELTLNLLGCPSGEHRELIASEVDRRAEMFERFRVETAKSVTVGTSRAEALQSVLDDLYGGRLWA